ncbi:hypothetical protein DFP72DRAFT_152457 [Ephemerocybe angulata]|uniref:DUF6697 domain-containing protein n=1 Tax=Ephemerocybe angulata TaxID=980116 RepID=A0A8H6HC30_9AGAR|nr:hypothetical protein DFP72DRAFT_152457 [Tulosesus angulatus]
MKTWENPKVKKKKEGVTIPEDIIISRFTAAGIPYVKFNVEMDQALRDEAVSRAFMSKVYGGSSQRTFPKPRPEKIDEHGLNDFMFLPEDYQPSAPFTPGAPGLWLNVQNDGEGPNVYDGQIKRLFSRIDKQSSPRLWLYQGQYELKVVKSLTIREWQAMDKPVRNTWAKEICDNNWGNPTQISIYARKEYGRAPTEDEKTDILARKLHDKITPADINAAFLCGEETLAVYTMKCVAHDGDFQRQVAERYTEWKANPPKATKRKRGSDENPKPEPKSESEEPMMTAARQNDGPAAKRQKSGVGAKRVRRSISPEEEHDSLWRPYTSKGTRSRPAKSWPGANS